MIFRSLGVLSLILLKLKAINWSPVFAEDDVITIVNNAFSYPSEANTVQITVKYINNSLHLARKYARIFVRGHYLFRVANSFPKA